MLCQSSDFPRAASTRQATRHFERHATFRQALLHASKGPVQRPNRTPAAIYMLTITALMAVAVPTSGLSFGKMCHVPLRQSGPGVSTIRSKLLRQQLGCERRRRVASIQLRGTSDIFGASAQVSGAALHIANKLAKLMAEVDAETRHHFGSVEPAPENTDPQPGSFQVDLRESTTAYQCIADMTGMSKQNIQVSLNAAAPVFCLPCCVH